MEYGRKMDKMKNIAYVVLAVLTIGGVFVNSIIGFAKAEDKLIRHDKLLEKHSEQISTLSDSMIEQKMSLNHIKEKQDDAKEDRYKIIEMLENINVR